MEDNDKLSDQFLIYELQKRLEEKDTLLKVQVGLLMEMEALNRRLVRAEKIKSGFLSNIRNEINNPLSSILGISGNILSGTMKGAEVKKYSAHIYQEAFNLDFQLKNIFAAAEIEAGEFTLNVASLNIREFINDQLRYLEPRSQQKAIKIELQLKNQIDFFCTDGYFLQMIILNLLANAVEFSPAGETVKVTLYLIEDQLVLSVEDKGPGISAAAQKSIFERFHQLEEGPAKKHRGHGLGLSIVKEFTDILKGELEISSVPNEGTRIDVCLPALSQDIIPGGCSFPGDFIIFGDEEVL